MFWVLVCSRISLISLIFSPMYLPFINPVWSGLTRSERTFSILLAITLDAIL